MPQRFNCLLGFKWLGFSVGVAALLGSSTSATAIAPSQTQVLAQNVEVETESQTSEANDVNRFACQLLNGKYTVIYYPQSQPDEAYPWAVPSELGGGWTPERRCNTIGDRLESYRPDGLLEMQTAVENNHNIVCVTTQQDPSCRIVLTVPPGQDPGIIRDRVFQNLTIADSGQETEAVNTFVGRGSNSQLLNQILNQGLSVLGVGNERVGQSNSINLRPFLDRADGGTGTRLNGGVRTPANPRLNPNNFR
ncbi:MAG: COP23 domain-containing protein [Kastovskya adunca ATA6-11-RM4]|jgi:hypothetical protein|nr:COP23 domain-containing protein [Kastovskya adunca ATA6-11-RM4]